MEIRGIADLGMVCIPKKFRRALGWNLGDELKITLQGDKVVLEKIEAQFSPGFPDGEQTHDNEDQRWNA